MIPYSLNPLGINSIVELSDLDILRQIRNANPTSQLPSLWLDSEDPYTQWEGLLWGTIGTNRVVNEINFTFSPIALPNAGVINLQNINKLKNLIKLELQGSGNLTGVYIDINVSGMTTLAEINWTFKNLRTLDMTNCPNIVLLRVAGNLLTSIPSLTSKGNITVYNFRYNNLFISETTRIIGLGFDSDKVLPQNP